MFTNQKTILNYNSNINIRIFLIHLIFSLYIYSLMTDYFFIFKIIHIEKKTVNNLNF